MGTKTPGNHLLWMDIGIGHIQDELGYLSARLLKLAQRRGLEIITVESCTGGLLSSYLTDVEGLSHVFNRALITYCDEAKTDLAHVPAKLIDEHGAVSEAVAQAMACGGRNLVSKDCIAIAVTGYAGSSPDGGTPGLVYIAVSTPYAVQCQRFQFTEDCRDDIRRAAVREALKMGLHLLADDPHY
ncbi:CinA family protein [Sphingorhabdus contaminans]|nr:CinA family protein [Sphingorhabdus contaminans]